MGETRSQSIPKSLNFAFGGISGMLATVVVQPLDLIKNNIQLANTTKQILKQKVTTVSVIREVIQKEGFFALYTGLSAGLLRQATYTTTRLGVYNSLFEQFSGPGKEPPSFIKKIFIGLTAGVVGSFVGTPAEICLIRMSADVRLPTNERRNYSNVLNALSRIVKEEGVTTLWRGAIPTMTRAAVVNVSQLVTYSQTKEFIAKNYHLSDGIILHFCASMFSGLVTTINSMPVDIAKTRIQNMRTVDGKPEFNGILDVITKLVRNEGIFSLWKGFFPYYFRIGPHTVLTFIFLEQMNKFYLKNNG